MYETKISKLNNEQRKLVEDNHNLIYSFLHKQALSVGGWYDICAIGLCKAALHYKGTTNFSTFAYICMLNVVRKEMRKNTLQKSFPDAETISLSTEISSKSEKSVYTLDEFIASKQDTEAEALGMVWAEWFIEKLPLTTLKVLLGKIETKTCRELSEEVGVSFSRCSSVMRRLQEYYKRNSRYVKRYSDDDAERKIYIEKILKTLDKMN